MVKVDHRVYDQVVWSLKVRLETEKSNEVVADNVLLVLSFQVAVGYTGPKKLFFLVRCSLHVIWT